MFDVTAASVLTDEQQKPVMTVDLSHLNLVEDSNQGHGLFYLDTDGLFAYINECCCRDIGYAREELIAHALDKLGVMTDCQNFMSMFKLCARHDEAL